MSVNSSICWIQVSWSTTCHACRGLWVQNNYYAKFAYSNPALKTGYIACFSCFFSAPPHKSKYSRSQSLYSKVLTIHLSYNHPYLTLHKPCNWEKDHIMPHRSITQSLKVACPMSSEKNNIKTCYIFERSWSVTKCNNNVWVPVNICQELITVASTLVINVRQRPTKWIIWKYHIRTSVTIYGLQ
jgi:hypothetical protein